MKRKHLSLSLILIFTVLGGFTFGFFSLDSGLEYTPRKLHDQLKNSPGKPATKFLAEIRNNQHTGLISTADMKLLQQEMESIGKSRSMEMEWEQMGPDNFGGRTRAILCVQVDETTVITYAAGVTGGIWRSDNLGTTWKKINFENDNLNVTCLVQTPNGDIYAGTGETFDAQMVSGLEDMGYMSGFMGQGVYKSTDGLNFSLLESTKPDFNNDQSEWAFVNELAVNESNGRIFASTNTGLKYSNDAGLTWSTAKDTDGNELSLPSWDVQVSSEGNVVACVNNLAYVSLNGDPDKFVMKSNGDSVSLPSSDVSRIKFAFAPSDPNIVYASVVDVAKQSVDNIYMSNDKGMNWRVIMPGTNSINVFNEQGIYNNALAVFPNNPDKILLGGIDLWQGEKILETGYYDWKVVSQSELGAGLSSYVHEDHHTYKFIPGSDNHFFVGTDGGVFLATIESNAYTYETGNRNYLTTQFYSVGISGFKDLLLGGAQDIGTISVFESSGVQIWEGEGGPCGVSIVSPSALVISTTDGIIRRSYDFGQNYSTFEQFPTDDLSNNTFRTPMILSENFTNENSGDSVYYYATDLVPGGTTIKVYSHNLGQPFPYTTPQGLTIQAGDSLLVQDIVTSYLFVGTQHNLWLTTNFLVFTDTADWFSISNADYGFVGSPYSMALSSDRNHLFVGTLDGRLYRLSNLATAYNYERADVNSPACIVSTTEIELKVPGADEPVSQVITSVSIDPDDYNNVIITLGNYGNDHYVLGSSNALDQFPEFKSRQGNLPHMPVYSSLIEMKDPKFAMLGTEKGIFITENIQTDSPTWVESTTEMGSVPVFQLTQQTIDQPVRLGEIAGVEVFYPGTHNFGSIYAATYGRGLFLNDNFYLVDMDEIFSEEKQVLNLKLYPNPVDHYATIEIESEHKKDITFYVYDLSGRMVKEQVNHLNAGLNEVTLDVSNLKKGAYVIRASSAANVYSQKFIVN